jgi:hypothetical protein
MISQVQGQSAVGITACYARRSIVEVELMRSPEGLTPNLSKEKRSVRGIESFAVNTECKNIAFRRGGETLAYRKYTTKAFPY